MAIPPIQPGQRWASSETTAIVPSHQNDLLACRVADCQLPHCTGHSSAVGSSGAVGGSDGQIYQAQDWMELPRVQEAEAYLRQVRMADEASAGTILISSLVAAGQGAQKEKFEEMERELLEAVADEASVDHGPLHPLGRTGGARTGLGTCQPHGRLRERPGADEELARKLQAEADAEVAKALAEGASHGSSGNEMNFNAAPSSAESDEMLARRLQAEADADAAIHEAAEDGESFQWRIPAAASRPAWDDEEVARNLQNQLDIDVARAVASSGPSSWPTQSGAHPDEELGALLFGGSRSRQAAVHQDMRRAGLGAARMPQAWSPFPANARRTPGSLATQTGPGLQPPSDALLRRVIDASASDEVGFAVPGAEPEVLAAATSSIVHSGSSSEGTESSAEQQCFICYESFQEGEQLLVLPCFHRFHNTCAERWLSQSRTCPICKHDITR